MGVMHYWIIADHEGKKILIYGGLTQKEAEEKGFQELDCFFEVKPFPTRDSGRASQLLKGQILNETQDLDHSLQRLKHTL